MLTPLAYTPFSPSRLKPTGWLYDRLRAEADGLCGNLDKVWPDIRDSMWIGGNRNDWERVPYWLDGIIPLAFLLDDDDLKARAAFYVNSILDRQAEDGWMPPAAAGERHHYDTWAVLLLAKVLTVWCDATGDKRAEEALYRALRHFNRHLDGTTLHNWGAARWFEGLIPIFWLYERYPEPWLLLLADKLDVQGIDWEKVFQRLMLTELNDSWDYLSHVVNLAMMLKSRALMSRLTGEDPNAFAKRALGWLRDHHGMASGHFTGDENLSGTSPIQGSELCSVVEAMYAFETLFSISGDPFWLECLENEAFNALPATFSPDMWSHQYVQLTNQVEASRTEKRVFRTNNEEAHIFGLEPHYGCCTANMAQGYPKLALSAIMKTDDGIAVPLPLPITLSSEIDGVPLTLEVISNYPFEKEITYRIKCARPLSFTLSLFVPKHTHSARLNGEAVRTNAFSKIQKTFFDDTLVLTFDYTTRIAPRPSCLYAIWHGPLLFSLPIGEKWEKREYTQHGVERKFPYCDYYVYPTTDWSYGFASSDIAAYKIAYHKTATPFDPKTPPITLTLPMVKIDWQKEDGRCTAYPTSIKPLSLPEDKALIPYGSTNLRLTEMPFARDDS